MRVEPFEIRAAGLGDFNKKAIYVSVWKDHDLSKVNELVNSFLRGYCEELFESYVPT
jgi:2'-5' RNA ligase